MVRCEDRHTLDNYEFLASIYNDLLMNEEDYKYWLEYINKFAKGKKVLELASGTGILAAILKKNGYEVLASDISYSMKIAAKDSFDGEYKIIDMRSFDLKEEFDVILCLLDSVNYLSNIDEFKSMISSVSKHLRKGGVFIFDSHSKVRIDEFLEPYIEEGIVDDVEYQWTIQSDPFEKTIHQHFAFYFENQLLEESHLQYVFNYQELKDCLKEVGFKVTFIEDFIPDEKVLFIGEKI